MIRILVDAVSFIRRTKAKAATIQNADRIVVLTDEGIVEDESYQALLEKNGYYTRLYKAQFRKVPVVVA